MREQWSEHSGKKVMDRKRQTEVELHQEKRGRKEGYLWKGGSVEGEKDKYSTCSPVCFRIFTLK